MAVVVKSKVQCLCAIFIMGNSVVDEMKFVCPVFYHCQCYQVQIVTTSPDALYGNRSVCISLNVSFAFGIGEMAICVLYRMASNDDGWEVLTGAYMVTVR